MKLVATPGVGTARKRAHPEVRGIGWRPSQLKTFLPLSVTSKLARFGLTSSSFRSKVGGKRVLSRRP
jgi:hypothetical protein